MALLFTGAFAGIATVSPLRADGAVQWSDNEAERPGPLERAAVRPTLDSPAPRRVFGRAAEWPDAATTYRFRTHLVLDASGRVAEARLVGPPVTTAVPHVMATELPAAREAVLQAVRQWQFEPPLHAPILLVTDVAVGSGRVAAGHVGSAERAPETTQAVGAVPLRVGGGIAPPKKLVDVKPVYPAAAVEAGVSGVVIIEATIDRTGQVSETRVLRSIPLLDEAALTAVRSWQYEPTWLNGEAVPVIMTCTVNFTLQ